MQAVKPLKIIFIIRSPEVFHHYQSIVRSLVSRGHRLEVLFDPRWSKGESLEAVQALQQSGMPFIYGFSEIRSDFWRRILFHTRELLSFRRYLVVEKHRQSRYYRDRWEGYLPRSLRWLLRLPLAKSALKSRMTSAFLKSIERVMPPSRIIVEKLRAASPDAVVAGPVNMRFSSADLEYLKAAVFLKIPTAVPVVSWDNLTTKGLFHVWPDRLLVWNDVQREEAIEHQFFPAERISMIGAPLFDGWFDGLKPSLARDVFCAAHHLCPDHPFILYLGSSCNVAQDETWVIKELRRALDDIKDRVISKVQIVVRPHPANYAIYDKLNLPGVSVIPRRGTLPDSSSARQLFIDTSAYALGVVVGANTTAVIDSIILGKPAIVFLNDHYSKTQLETLHFKQLLEADVFDKVRTPEGFIAAVNRLLKGEDTHKEARERYIQSAVRPWGLERSAGEIAADEIERLAEEKKTSFP